MNISDLLLPGRENAIQSKLLADALGFKSVRHLQKEIERERVAGAVILSTTQEGGGYYSPSCESEVVEFIRTLSNRAKHTYAAVQSAQDYLDGQTGQSTMWGV